MKSLRVVMLGLRGFPNVQGGVERHAEHLCAALAALGCDVTAVVRSPYMHHESADSWRDVKYRRIWCPRSKGLEAVIHSTLAVLYCALVRPDIVHIQAIGPSLVVPLARLLGLRVVVTHHGPDYDREKWGGFARTVLRLGERFGMTLAHQRIVISRVIAALVKNKYATDAHVIPNGTEVPRLPLTRGALDTFGLEDRRYVLMVARLVPEKRHLDLINAFAAAAPRGWKLVLVGSSDHPDDYSRAVLAAAEVTPNVVATGFQTGLALHELYAHAGLFVLPSTHEGHPIALLEALGYGLPAVVSDIPANRGVGPPPERCFPPCDVDALTALLKKVDDYAINDQQRAAVRTWVRARYDWSLIAQRTLEVYRRAITGELAQTDFDEEEAGEESGW